MSWRRRARVDGTRALSPLAAARVPVDSQNGEVGYAIDGAPSGSFASAASSSSWPNSRSSSVPARYAS